MTVEINVERLKRIEQGLDGLERTKPEAVAKNAILQDLRWATTLLTQIVTEEVTGGVVVKIV